MRFDERLSICTDSLKRCGKRIHGTDAYQRHCAGLTLLSCSAAFALTRGFAVGWGAPCAVRKHGLQYSFYVSVICNPCGLRDGGRCLIHGWHFAYPRLRTCNAWRHIFLLQALQNIRLNTGLLLCSVEFPDDKRTISELSPYHCQKAMERALRLAKLPTNNHPEHLKFAALRQFTSSLRL